MAFSSNVSPSHQLVQLRNTDGKAPLPGWLAFVSAQPKSTQEGLQSGIGDAKGMQTCNELGRQDREMDLQSLIQQLALFLASWQATAFLIGEYAEDELRDNPILTVADGFFWLRQTAERNSFVRKLQIVKL